MFEGRQEWADYQKRDALLQLDKSAKPEAELGHRVLERGGDARRQHLIQRTSPKRRNDEDIGL